MISRRVIIPVVLVFSLSLGACTDEPPARSASNLGEVAPSTYLAGSAACYPRVESDFRRWSPSDPEQDWFGRIGAVRLLSAERWVVSDPSRMVLHILEADGEGRAMGGPGEGPGEFRHLTRLWLPGPSADTIAVFDQRTQRISYFDPEGGFLHDERVSGGPLPALFGSFPGGAWIERRVITRHSGGTEGGFWRDSVRFFKRNGDHTVPLTGALPDTDRYQIPTEFGFGVLLAPWGLRPTYSLSRSGVLVIGSGEEPLVRLFGEAGESVLPLPDFSREITASDAAAEREDRLTGAAQGDPRALMYEESAPPERTPQYVDARLDDDGWLWIGRYPKSGEPPRYVVLGSDGIVLQEVELPPGSRLGGAAGGTVLAMGIDTLDVPVLYMASRRCP